MLELHDIRTDYGGIEVLHGIDMHVGEGEVVALISSNGAGKTTTMRTICDILSPGHGEITYRDETIYSKASHEIVEHGTVQVLENRDLFTNMTVTDNLPLGAQTEKAETHRRENLDEMLELFPRLMERKNQYADTMPGGEQQMPILAHALMGGPDLPVLDRSSIGLAPHPIQEVPNVIEDIHAQGMTALMVEQSVQQTLKLADRSYIIENDYIGMTANDGRLLEDEDAIETYLGV